MIEFDPNKTHVFIVAKENMVSLELAFWLRDGLKIPGPNILSVIHEHRDFATIWNTAIRSAINTPGRVDTQFILCEGDVKPQPQQVAPFLKLDTDIRVCEYKGEGGYDSHWSTSTSFHLALWWTHRQALQKIPPPWVEWPYSPDHCSHTACLCQSFREKALNAGLTIGHGGYVKHKPRCPQKYG
jgi:hypothetical protein